jgi:hypothetical protein
VSGLGGANRHASHLSRKKAELALLQLLLNCRQEKLAEFTSTGLAGSYRVPLAKVETMLRQAREARAA